MNSKWYYPAVLLGVALGILIAVLINDTDCFFIALLYAVLFMEDFKNPVARLRRRKKAPLPTWMQPRHKNLYWLSFAVVFVFWTYLLFMLPEDFDQFDRQDYLQLSAFILVGVTLGFVRRNAMLADAPENLENLNEYLQLQEDDNPDEVYVSVMSFKSVDEAESFQKLLEEKGIPSMIYGANRPDYIPEEALPIQVMVKKKHKGDVDKLLDSIRS